MGRTLDNFSIDKLDSNQETILNKLFMKVQTNLVEEVGQSAFKSWLSSLRLSKLDNHILYLYMPYYKDINISPCTFALNKIPKHTGHVSQTIKKNDRRY